MPRAHVIFDPSDLPDITRKRLVESLRHPAATTILIDHSRRGLPLTGIVLCALCVLGVTVGANNYRWSMDTRLQILGFAVLSFLAAGLGATSLIGWHRSNFGNKTLINPCYILRFRLDSIEAFILPFAVDWKVDHHYDNKGCYKSTSLEFIFEDGNYRLKVDSLPVANQLVRSLKAFPSYLARLAQQKDTDTIYAIDLLYEWKMREKEFPRAQAASVTSVRRLGRAYVAPLLLALIMGTAFFFTVDYVNDYFDDERRWADSTSKGTATAYRLYLAARPVGRHIAAARRAVDELYQKAGRDYTRAAGFETTEGVAAVMAALDYARRSGNYRVTVLFSGDNHIQPDIEGRLRRKWGFPSIVPVHPSFSQSANQSRENRILQRISESFGKVIPGDVLQFVAGSDAGQDISFRVNYTIADSGDLYYPEKQESRSERSRDWYTGISFDWHFEIYVPGRESLPFEFTLESRPADLFHVASRAYAGRESEMSAGQVYDAMADSTFSNFAARLLSELSVP